MNIDMKEIKRKPFKVILSVIQWQYILKSRGNNFWQNINEQKWLKERKKIEKTDKYRGSGKDCWRNTI